MSRASIPHLAAQEDARLALASEAARTERHNQPKALLVGAGVLLVAALVYLLMSYQASRSALATLDDARSQADTAILQAARLKALREAAAVEGPNLVRGTTQVYSRIQQAGADAGLKASVNLPGRRVDKPPGSGSQQTRMDYDVKDESLPALLDWMHRATEAVPGLEVYSISLRPEQHQWSLRVTFSRWEKIEGT